MFNIARQSKCTICKNSFPSEEMMVKSNKKYCQECYQEKELETERKKGDWGLLFKCICELYNIDKPTGMMFKQLKDYRNDYSYTDIGMYYTLNYYHKTLENEVLEGSGLGIIPYYYDKAKAHYSRVFDNQDILENHLDTEQTVIIKTTKINKALKATKPISLELVRKDDAVEDID